jgi:predicted acetyltransferase
MASLLFADHEAGRVFSNLYPFRESFYERMGYVAYPLIKIARFPVRTLEATLKMDTGGEIKLQYIGEAYDEYRQYLAQKREHQHGMAFFDFGDRGRANLNLVWVAFAVFDGQVEGIMMYRIMGEEVTKYQFSASRFYYRSNRARYLMLDWIARHIDQAEQAEIWLAGDEYPETWLSDLEMKVEVAVRPAMSRVLDIVKLGGMLVGEGRFTARIVDPICPWNEGDWHFEGNESKLSVTKAATSECELTIQGLSALVSGVHDPQEVSLRGWGNSGNDTQSRIGAMFPKRFPYMHEMF